MNGMTTPVIIQAILDWPLTWLIARSAVVAMYLASGLSKVVDFPGGVAEMVSAGLPAPVTMAALSVVVELAGSALVLANHLVWLGAGMLSAFTAIGAVTTHAFWKVQGAARKDAINVFFMHVGLIGAFALDALLAERIGR